MANSTKSIDPSLWWDPFTSILTDLENAPLTSQLHPSIEKKLKENHGWFVDTVSLFKKPNAQSREALNSKQVKIGSHELIIKPQFKDKALQISSYLCLDELQSYILVERSLEINGLAVDSVVEEYLHVVLLHYYIERQCLLKCTRQILMHALYVGISSGGENVIRDEAMKLISDGLECALISVLQDLLSSSPSENMDVDLFTLWAEGILIEDNLVLDILFLIYYESLCTCNGETWKKLCSLYKGILFGSYNFGKLAISNEALKSSSQAKVQLLLVLMETLNLENLLRLVHDETPFRSGASVFSLADIQQMDVLVSSLNAFEMEEAGPLILTWAVCLCLITSLPRAEEINVLMEIDHVGYLRQAFESASLNYFVDILDSDLLKESDGPVAGYRSVLRTFVSAFIASYEINLQSEDSNLNLILDIICKIYRGEESLCNQFWDKGSFIDGPIRCLLCSLEGEFPFRSAELVRLLSSLCEGRWPTECVFNFLDKSVGISSLFEITSESLVDSALQIVETNLPLHVPGVEGLFVPSKTRGHVLKVIGGNTALVRWEHKQSGLLILLLQLAQELHLESTEYVFLTLDLLCRMVSFSTAVTFSLMDLGNSYYFQDAGMTQQMERDSWVVEIICAVIKKSSLSSSGATIMSMGVSTLAKMLKCAPTHVAAVALRSNVFEMNLKTSVYDVGYDGLSSGSWLVSGKLAKMLLIDAELNDNENPLAISVLEFTMQLVETRLNNDLVLALAVFSLQFILINHEYWKYRVKHVRWKVTLKVLDVMKTCIMSISFSEKLGVTIRDILLCDSSIHSVIFRLICTTKRTLENLYVSRLVEIIEIEEFQHAISSALDVLCIMLSKFSEDISRGLPVFLQAVLSSSIKPIPVVAAVISLISFTRNPAIQVGAAKALSTLLIMADYLQPYMSSNLCLGLDDEQIADLRHSVKSTLFECGDWNGDLFIAIVNLLTSAARHQPPFLVAVVALKADTEFQSTNAGDTKQSSSETSNAPLPSHKSSLLDEIMRYIEKASDFINSNPRALLVVLDFLKALWQGAVHYINILECLRNSKVFWKHLTGCISLVTSSKTSMLENLSTDEAQLLAYKNCCQSVILEIMAYEIFLEKKLLHVEPLIKEATQPKNSTGNLKSASDCELKDILSSWCDMSILGNLVKSCTSCEYDNEISYRAKVATSLFLVHVMGKLDSGNAGSLSLSLLEKIQVTLKNLICQPAFSELLAQYSQRGYSEGRELKSLILNDLYYHLQGELEGRKMGPGPFRELFLYLVESKCLHYQHRYKDDGFSDVKNIYLYDLIRIRIELGLDMWDYTGWKEYKAVAETMLDYMQQVNSMVMLSNSKLSILKALITVLTTYEDNDQAIAVVSELCNANKLKQIPPEIQDICLMLFQIMEMALYLELCVLQICGIRSVLGRVEDFSKLVKMLLKAMEGQAFLKASIESLKQIISHVYPGLLQTEGFV
ncbi:uncharacterized protein LOC126683413 isoform X2 [Mercurialis annua]|uniref:uncharacterized protein LOC126683413 isoform X2 n=1 Tax=Mercurialis annua TaxID=3986 RepID=UPI0024AC8F01|nr:uncharacterized protein LOC126683413 isoform X2 [Mercurialis annua]